MAGTLDKISKVVAHAWSEPKALLQWESGVDADWWEPRWDQPWRRQVARDREQFGGEFVARARPPLEGPNNPNRIRRELEVAQQGLDEAIDSEEEAEEAVSDALFEVASLRARLKDAGHA